MRRNAAIVVFALMLVPSARADDAESIVREAFVRFAAGDARGLADLWTRRDAADAFLARHRRRFDRRCMRIVSLRLEAVSQDPPIIDAFSTISLRTAPDSPEWWESADARMTLQRDGAQWRIVSWEPKETETTASVRLAAQRSIDLGNRGELAAAAKLIEQTIDVAERLGEPAALSTALGASSYIERASGRIDIALTRAERALALAERAGDPDALARALLRLARTREHFTGIPDRELLTRAIALTDDVEDLAVAAHIAVHLGRSYELRGELREAFRYAGLGARFAEQSGDVAARAAAAMFLHGAYLQLGDLPLARLHADRAAELTQSAGFESAVSITVAGALGLTDERKFEEAHRLLTEELDRVKTPLGRAEVLRARARVQILRRLFDAAARDLERGLALDSSDAARQETFIHLSVLETNRGDFARALEYTDAARGSNSFLNGIARHQHAGILMLMGRYEEARAALEKLLEEHDAVALQEPAQTLFQGRRDTPRRLLVELLATQGEHDAALRLSEELKSQGLLDAVARGPHAAAAMQSKHPQELVIEERIRDLNRRLTSGTLSSAVATSAREQLNSARLALLDLRQRLYAGGPAVPVEQSMDLCIDDLPPHLDQTTIVSYAVSESRTTVFVIGPKRNGRRELTVRFIEISAQELELAAMELATLIEQRNLRANVKAVEMYERLVAPIEADIRDARLLCIVPDFAQWRVPFHILGPRNGPLLVERMPVYYAPSITILAATQRRAPSNAKPRLLAFANPVVGADTASLYRAFDANAPLGEIPETAAEVREIAKIYGRDASRVYIGETASETKLKQEAPRYDVLHIATHGLVYDTQPMFSSLLLTASPDDNNDGVLEAREIATMSLRADLAVLSACETGRANATGNGVIGLSWAFLAAGCPTTVVSQWNTQSAAAATMAVEFHRQLARGHSKPEALRRAQLALRKDKRYRHPFYWAPFVVIGSP